MLNCLIVGIGGFVGAASRYLFTLLPFHRSGAFPLHTLLINLIGSFCIGMLVVAASKTSISPRLLLLLKTGVCGGFTTFSTAMVEALTARSEGKTVKFLMLWLVQVLGAVVAAIVGAWLFSLIFGRYIAPVFPPDVLY